MQLFRTKTTDGAAGARRQENNKKLGKRIINKLSAVMYEIAAVLKNKDFIQIDNKAQKSITDSKKKLTNYEKKAHAAMSSGEDIDITLDQVAQTVKEASHAVGLVNTLLSTQVALAAIGK